MLKDAVITAPKENKPLSFNQIRARIRNRIIPLMQKSGVNTKDKDLFHLINKLTLINLIYANNSIANVSEILAQTIDTDSKPKQKEIYNLIALLHTIGSAGQITANQNYEIAHTKLLTISKSDNAIMNLIKALGGINTDSVTSELPKDFPALKSPLMSILYNPTFLIGHSSINQFLHLLNNLPDNLPEHMKYSDKEDTDLITGETTIQLLEELKPLSNDTNITLTRDTQLQTFWDNETHLTYDILKDIDNLPDQVILPIKFQDILQGIFIKDIDELLKASDEIKITLTRLILAKYYSDLTFTLNYTHENAIKFISQILIHNPVLNNEAARLKPLFSDELQRLKLINTTKKKDTALATAKINRFTKGGMDFNSIFLKMETYGDNEIFSFTFDIEKANQINIGGLTPSIINMTLINLGNNI